MHQRERVTNADEMLENRVRHLLTGPEAVDPLTISASDALAGEAHEIGAASRSATR
jgi:hypothetical protein